MVTCQMHQVNTVTTRTHLVPVSIILSFILILYALYESWAAGASARNNANMTIHTALVLTKSEQLLRHAIDTEVGMRRYFVTFENTQYLTMYGNSKRLMLENAGELQQLTRDNPMQQKRVATINKQIENKVAELQNMLLVSKTQGREAAYNLIAKDQGKVTMDNLRADIAAVQEMEKRILQIQSDEFARAYKRQTIFILSAIVGAFLVAGATVLIINKQIRDLRRSRAELGDLNATLEQKVNERTRDLLSASVELEQKHAEAAFERSRVELLLRELNHRVGNNLAMVSAFLGIEAAHTKNVEARDIIDRARTRIQGIATTQRRLQLEEDLESANAEATLTEVAKDLLSTSLHAHEVSLETAIEPLSLAQRDITSIAIILSELVTNALKYAFASQSNAVIAVGLQQLGSGVILTVNDNGSGFDVVTPDAAASGLGRTIIDRLARQYGGSVEWSSHIGTGTSVSVRLPKMSIRKKQDDMAG